MVGLCLFAANSLELMVFSQGLRKQASWQYSMACPPVAQYPRDCACHRKKECQARGQGEIQLFFYKPQVNEGVLIVPF